MKGHRVGYVVHEYPSWTQTFSLRQISELLRQGVEVLPVASKQGPDVPPEQDPAPPPSAQLLPGLLSRQMLSAQLSCFAARPVAYLRLLIATVSSLRAGVGAPRWLPLADFVRGAALARMLDTELADVSHLHGEFAGSEASIALVAATLARRTFSFSSHSSQYEPLMRLKLREAAFVTPTSQYEASRLISRYGASSAKLHLLHIGVPHARGSSRRSEGARSSPSAILSVGSLQEKKGHEYLIRAVARLLAREIPVRCTIVGGGPLEQSLASLAGRLGVADRVTLAGWLPSAEITALTREADVFCLACVTSPSSGTDGIPFALMEAMQLGVPCVSTWTAGIPELIMPGVTGLLVPPADPGGLADAIETLLADHELQARLGRQGAEHVAEHFDLSANMAELAGLFRSGGDSVVSDRSAGRGRPTRA